MDIIALLKKLKNIRLLPPRDKEFYVLFDEMAGLTVESSNLLVRLFEAHRHERNEIEVKIATLLTRCDLLVDSVNALLRSAQQPPFDRSLINEFTDNLFRIMKYINHAANRYIVYDFPSSDKEMREMAPIIAEACSEITKAIKTLNRNRNFDPFYKAVDRLEGQADDIYHEGLRRRFHEIREDRARIETHIHNVSNDATCKEILPIIMANVEYTRHVAVFFALRQVYAELERSIDACTDLTATLKRMVTGNA
jgi:uncharacterized protein